MKMKEFPLWEEVLPLLFYRIVEGVQKEAFWLRVPCITLRDETEWVETVRYRWNRLVGADKEKILDAVRDIKPGEDVDFMNEYAARKICGRIEEVSYKYDNY